MNILLVGVNSKFIHTNLALYYLKDFAESYMSNSEKENTNIEIAEYTINNEENSVISDIYNKKADVIAFSVYIWNVSYIKNVISSLIKITDAKIILGGPEVSFESENVLREIKGASIITRGEGEETFLDLISYYNGNLSLEDIKGITYVKDIDNENKNKSDSYNEEKIVVSNSDRMPLDMNKLVYTYKDRLDKFENKIIYYETSRGCPFRCSYCMSSVDKKVRYKSLDKVFSELKDMLDKKVMQIKFVDRTFNCNKERTMKIWQFLKDNDNGITNFHFELAIEIFDEEMAKLLNSLRPGQVQCEIGVQTTNKETLKEIDRHNDMELIRKHVAMIKRTNNVHVHLDLIAGLPYEDYESFKNSFNEVYLMRPSCLQLGFLKVLKGTKMYENRNRYGIAFKDVPPYEVLKTNWITYEDIMKLKDIENLLDSYYNAERYYMTLRYIERKFENPFKMYEKMAEYWKENNYYEVKHSMVEMLEILFSFGLLYGCNREILENIMRFELYMYERPSKEPKFFDREHLNDETYKEYIKEKTKILKSEEKLKPKHQFEKFKIDIYDMLNDKNYEKDAYEIKMKDSVILFEYIENENKIVKQKEKVIITYDI